VAASPLAGLFDKRRMALSAARLKAWWEGAVFDQEAFEAQLAAEPAANDSAAAHPVDPSDPAGIFEAEPDPRLVALQLIWGERRLGPGEPTMEELVAGRLAMAETGALAVSGVGLAEPVLRMGDGHPGPIRVLEWRKETRAALAAGLKAAGLDSRVEVTAFDLETGHCPEAAYDGLISVDDFTYADNPARLALQFVRGLKPGAGGLIECYAGVPGPDIAPGFASAFAEPQINPAGKIGELLFEAGFRIDEDEDVTALHSEWAREGFQRVKTALDISKLTPRALQELAWELETWKARLRLLDARRLERRVWRVTRR